MTAEELPQRLWEQHRRLRIRGGFLVGLAILGFLAEGPRILAASSTTAGGRTAPMVEGTPVEAEPVEKKWAELAAARRSSSAASTWASVHSQSAARWTGMRTRSSTPKGKPGRCAHALSFSFALVGRGGSRFSASAPMMGAGAEAFGARVEPSVGRTAGRAPCSRDALARARISSWQALRGS